MDELDSPYNTLQHSPFCLRLCEDFPVIPLEHRDSHPNTVWDTELYLQLQDYVEERKVQTSILDYFVE